MSTNKAAIQAMFSARLEGDLDGNTAREIDRVLAEDADLAEEYSTFAGVISLLGTLPKPEPDPEFAAKVRRRIARRQRGRRRARREPTPLPLIGTFSALVALVLVATVGYIGSRGGEMIAALDTRGAAAPIGIHIAATLATSPDAAQTILIQARAQGLVTGFELPAPGSPLLVSLHQDQLAAFIEWLSGKLELRLGQMAGTLPAVGIPVVLHVVAPATP